MLPTPVFTIISTLIIISTSTNAQGLSQHFERHPDPEYRRLKGMNIEIPCIVRNLQGECSWLHDGRVVGPIPGKYMFERRPKNGVCSLKIEMLDLKLDNGEWQCQVTAPTVHESSLQSRIAKLIVLVAPEKPFLKGLVRNRLTVQADRQAEVECQVNNGNPPPQIEWFIDNVNVTGNSRNNVLSSDSTTTVHSYLTHTFKRSHMNATIVCQALHPTINQKDETKIDVQYPPQVSVPQNVYTVNENSHLEIECKVEANPPANPIWKQLTNVHFNDVDLTRGVLKFNQVTRNMNGHSFECLAQNELGQAEPAVVKLDVLYQPRLLRSSEPQQSVRRGESTQLFCDYDGNPKPEILWYHINPITDVVRHRPNEVRNASVLLINNASYHDEGHYYCEASNFNKLTNENFIVRSAKFVVDIIGRPQIIQNPSTIKGVRGASSEVYQLFCSDPAPTNVYWTFGSIRFDVNLNSPLDVKNDKNNSLHNRYAIRNLFPLDKSGFSSSPTCFHAALSISNTDLSDQREYTLFVENVEGATESVVKLKVVTPLSAGMMIAIGLIVLVLLLTLTVVTMVLIRRRRQSKTQDDESKAEAQTPMKPDDEKSDKEIDKEKGEHHELVYANLEFTKSSESKPQKSKPQVVQRQHRTNGGATEYAQITFTNKADL